MTAEEAIKILKQAKLFGNQNPDASDIDAGKYDEALELAFGSILGRREQREPTNPFMGRLRFLMDETGISARKLSVATGIGESTINYYSSGRIFPGIGSLVQLADFFAVPLDYLVGRCDKETDENIQKDYAAHYMALRREPYEMYLAGRNRLSEIPRNCEAPWPYNLLDDIVSWKPYGTAKWEDKWQEVLSPDQEAGLEAALESLTERERECVLAYYRDGLTLEGVGKIHGVNRERIRQINSKAVRKLRHPSRFNQIRYGLEGAKQKSEYSRLEQELAQKKQELDSLDEELGTREKALAGRAEALSTAAVGIDANVPLGEMDLSVRSYNALKRAGCDTIGDVEELVQAGELHRLRNMGSKSIEEVLGKLATLTGRRF